MNLKLINGEMVVKALTERNVSLSCHRCGSDKFDFVSNTILSINQEVNTITVGGASIPAAIIACSNCGVLSTHALGALGLVDLESKK